MRKFIASIIIASAVLSAPFASASSIPGGSTITEITIPDLPDSSGLFPSIPNIPTPSDPVDQGKEDSISYWENQMFSEMNAVRAQNGLAPFQWSDRLHADGKSWANEMSDTNVYHHDPKLGVQNQGENIWMTWDDTPHKSTQMFMDSPGHRANILGPYSQASVSLSYNDDRNVWYIVHRFAW